MTSIRKFLFDNPFDAPGAPAAAQPAPPPAPEPEPEPPPPPPPPPEPTFSAAELAAARNEGLAQGQAHGYADGLARGKAEAEATIDTQIAQALARTADGVTRLLKDRAATNAARTEQPLRIGLAIVRKLLPEMVRRHGLAEIEAMINACLADVIDEPRLTVRIHADLVGEVRGRLEPLVANAGFEGRLVVLADNALGPGDCRVEWAEGGAERDTAHLLADIDRAAARLLSAP